MEKELSKVYNPAEDNLKFTTLLRYDPEYNIGIDESLNPNFIKRDMHNTMRHDDISVACTRKASEYYFNSKDEFFLHFFIIYFVPFNFE